MQPPYPAPVTEWHNDTYDAIDPKRPELSQAGKTIVVTGAGQGIGQEVVDAFAQAGASTIHILGRTKRTLEETKGIVEKKYSKVNITIHVADIVDTAAVKKAAGEIGAWDVLVANAGYIPSPDLIEDSDAEEWWKTFEVCHSYSAYQFRCLYYDRSTSREVTFWLALFFRTRRLAVRLLPTQVALHSCLQRSPFSQRTRRIPLLRWQLLGFMSSWLSKIQI